MAILASEEKIRRALDRAFYLGKDVERSQRWGLKVYSREDLNPQFDQFVEDLKTS